MSVIIRLALTLCVLTTACGGQVVTSIRATGHYPPEVHRMIRERLQKAQTAMYMDGTWSSWGSWSPCSRSCGGGVTVQTRQCISRPKDSRLSRVRRRRLQPNDPKPPRSRPVNQCVGLYKRHQLCNEQSCPGVPRDFRAEQCASFNARPFRGKIYFWEPYLETGDECALNCRPVGQEFYATLNKTVRDGTPCRRPITAQGTSAAAGTRGVCVEGRCKSVGSSGVVGLDSRGQAQTASTGEENGTGNGVVDACAACSSGSSPCRMVSGLFTRPQMPPGYSPIATIPRGACHINITQLRPSRNYLALRNPDGTYILNGNWNINWTSVFEAAGTHFEYHRQDGVNGESINGPGPLLHPIDLVIVYQAPNTGIKYDYKLPLGAPVHHHQTVEQIAPPLIDARKLDRTSPPTVHSQADEAPRSAHRVNRTRRKKFAWKMSSLTPCTKTCGGGVQQTVIICVREHNQTPVTEKRCSHLEKPVPHSVRCNQQPCPAYWGGTWSTCSAECGPGEQRRTLECLQEINSKLIMRVNEGACLESKPSLTRPCFVKECDKDSNNNISSNDLTDDEDLQSVKPYWKTGPWSECSVTCGFGQQTRIVSCAGGSGSGTECIVDQRPQFARRCETPRCEPSIENEYKTPQSRSASLNPGHPWLFTEWSQHCSEECGTGYQSRLVTCPHAGACSEEAKPDSSRACSSEKHCGGKWYTGPWGRCNEPCSKNPVQSREVICVVHIRGQSHIVSDKTCPANEKPAPERRCDERCVPQWYMSDWTECEGSCPDGGAQRRYVRCLDEMHRDVDCEADRPPVKRTCVPNHCSRVRNDTPLGNGAKTGEPRDEPAVESGCTDRISLCQAAVQARLCPYKYYQTACCLSCRRAPELPRD